MLFSRSAISLAVLVCIVFINEAASQNSSSGTSTAQTTTPSGNVMTHVVQVGDAAGTKLFYPEKIKAQKGDLVQFHFYPKEHSIAQSSFNNPCQPLENTNGSSTAGFWSGFMPVTAESKTMPVFSILVNDTKPIWFYCATMMHCQSGMSGVINEPDDKTLESYKEAAMSVEKTGIPQGTASGGSNGTEAGLDNSVASNIPTNASDTFGDSATGTGSGRSPSGPTTEAPISGASGSFAPETILGVLFSISLGLFNTF